MNKIILTAGIVLASATASFADSSALDIYTPQPVNASAIDFTATAATGVDYQAMSNPRLGDGAPSVTFRGDSLDYSATSAIDVDANAFELGPRLGDGVSS